MNAPIPPRSLSTASVLSLSGKTAFLNQVTRSLAEAGVQFDDLPINSKDPLAALDSVSSDIVVLDLD
ncbi:MAG TPA: hypothetical protein VF744_03200, partial [Beijerinckiaceae bacterium]